MAISFLVSAVIFDLDRVLVDSGDGFDRAWDGFDRAWLEGHAVSDSRAVDLRPDAGCIRVSLEPFS